MSTQYYLWKYSYIVIEDANSVFSFNDVLYNNESSEAGVAMKQEP